jgi:predicted flap endonuclease-1-like 5' DNA nuclease
MAHASFGPFALVQTTAQSSAICMAARQQQSEAGAWIWAIILVIFFALMVVLWLWLDKTFEKQGKPATHAVRTASPPQASVAPSPDDLKLIEGIGPKISGLLQDQGITTFAGLAQADVAHLNSILKEANLRLAHPETWPEQARLAASGAWDELQKLQDELKGGVHVG